ncbi:MAG TPA: bifunctional acetate--CoA ligase family protein/GNAT family N-acetyltransferase [Candidatus Angelobacter sp.]|nr:bifunctional acetate--CoA ligase family protein/GNAT family N-acetyltransferase [Candidatus Angelobacter sp.]
MNAEAGTPAPAAVPDRASDILGVARQPLEAIFSPRSVAVVGATERSGAVGRTILENLLASPFGGSVHPVNPTRGTVLGLPAVPRLGDLPEAVDLAVIVTPAATVPDVVDEAVELGIPAAVIISAGFRETGPQGAALEERIRRSAQGRMRIIGPNCLGVMNPRIGLNATFATRVARPGNVGLVSQSGALLTAILDWAEREAVGFSRVVSLGSMLDVGWGDVIDHLGDDPHTTSIVMYMETIGDARAFLSAAREVAASKPIVVIKPGRSSEAARAAASHTGSLAGSDEALAAAFRRVGVLRVDTISELFYAAEVLATQPRPRGRKLSMVTNAGGPGVLATDTLIEGGGVLAELSDATLAALDAALPAAWSHGNPVDVLGDADAERYETAASAVLGDPDTDGLLVILTPQAMTDATGTAERIAALSRGARVPVLASWMGAEQVAEGRRALRAAGIPSFPYPDLAARLFNFTWRWADNLRSLSETPALPVGGEAAGAAQAAGAVLEAVRAEGRTLLTERESKQLLAAYGIPVVDTRVAADETEAVAAAGAIGYPVVVKLHSRSVTHKTDVDGVRLNLADAEAVRRAVAEIREAVESRVGPGHVDGVTVQPMIRSTGYELIVGSSTDPQLGPVLLFGLGGQLVEVLRDRALGLPPLNTTLARRMIERTRIAEALRGVRGRAPIDLGRLEELLVRFSQLVVEHPTIAEIDINPLLASPERLLALDARVVLHPADLPPDRLPRPAIRPYPTEYVRAWRTPDGVPLTIRPIRPEDEPSMVRFHEGLSPETVHARYFSYLRLSDRTAHDRLARVCFIDYDRVMALVAEHAPAGGGDPEIVGVGRLIRLHGRSEGEFAILVADAWQRRGIGTVLLSDLVAIGRREGLHRIVGDILESNVGMQRVSRRLGFGLRHDRDAETVTAELDLEA